ncbi:response regulator [Oceanobacillus halophilus]|uniref:Response regulator n=1 Tax=Oceanobacillus halophilus TaxID=930130 RepID=A0A495A3K8_9BACI|nr:response regulator [Oceanobacillus halophilus]RKQ32699.1 response regulator [Oceanobacillus halophilus]
MTKILITEDSLFMRNWLKGILQQFGYTDFIEAVNGEEAIEKYKNNNPDIVLLDLTLPVMDGLTALNKMMEYDSNAKIVMCSALGTEYNVRKALKYGATSFVVKPYFQNLENVIDRALTN